MSRTNQRLKIVEYWMQKEPSFIDDPYKPSCFACGFDGYGGWNTWGTARLDEAHIVAESIGGKAEPSNLLLLCKRCHSEAPMTSIPWVLLDWARQRQSHVEYAWTRAESAIRDAGIENDQVARHIDLISKRAILAAMKALRVDRHPHCYSPDFAGVAAAMKIWLDMQDGVTRLAPEESTARAVRAMRPHRSRVPLSHEQAMLPLA
jgi:hypothetical protein